MSQRKTAPVYGQGLRWARCDLPGGWYPPVRSRARDRRHVKRTTRRADRRAGADIIGEQSYDTIERQDV